MDKLFYQTHKHTYGESIVRKINIKTICRFVFPVYIVPVLILIGCAQYNDTPYNLSNSYISSGKSVSTPVVDTIVLNYPVEYRPYHGLEKIGTGILILIPLVPYGKERKTPDYFIGEHNTDYSYSFISDLGETIKKDLEESGICRQVIFNELSESPQKLFDQENYSILNIKVKEAALYNKPTLYGLSLPGLIIWLFAAPSSYSEVYINMKIELKDSNEKIIAQQIMDSHVHFTRNLYKSYKGIENITLSYSNISLKLRRFLVKNLSNL